MKIDIQRLMKNLIFISLLLIFMTYCQSQSNQYSSAEKTWNKLVQSAREKNFQNFVSCIDLTIVFQRSGHSKAEAYKLDEKVKDNINSDEFDEVRGALSEYMMVFTESDFIVINEKEEGLNLRALEVKCIPKSSEFRKSEEKWYFTNCDGKWLISFEVTVMKTGY